MKRLCQCDVTTIRERSNNQSFGATKKLILVNEVDVSDGNEASVSIFNEIKSNLLEPFEVGWCFDVILYL